MFSYKHLYLPGAGQAFQFCILGPSQKARQKRKKKSITATKRPKGKTWPLLPRRWEGRDQLARCRNRPAGLLQTSLVPQYSLVKCALCGVELFGDGESPSITQRFEEALRYWDVMAYNSQGKRKGCAWGSCSAWGSTGLLRCWSRRCSQRLLWCRLFLYALIKAAAGAVAPLMPPPVMLQFTCLSQDPVGDFRDRCAQHWLRPRLFGISVFSVQGNCFVLWYLWVLGWNDSVSLGKGRKWTWKSSSPCGQDSPMWVG